MSIRPTPALALSGLLVLAGTGEPSASPGAELPFELHRGFLVLVQVQLGPVDGLTFILDTGAARTVVDTRIVRRLGLAGRPADVLTFGASMTAEEVAVPPIRVGPIATSSLQVLAMDLSGLPAAHGVCADGILGADVLRGACFAIDYRTRRLLFGSAGAWKTEVPFDRESPYLVVKAEVDGVPFRLIVDTGAQALVLFERTVPRGWADRMTLESGGSDLAGSLSLRPMLTDRVRLGRSTWHRLPVFVATGAAPDARFYDGVLGPRALGITQAQFDLDRMVFRFER
jgi:hypothetical protein